jgi:hypothetical protein
MSHFADQSAHRHEQNAPAADRRLTATAETRRFATIVIEDLNGSGTANNHSLAGAVPDCGFHENRQVGRQLVCRVLADIR